jgi:plasmid stabilization system protein ParE
VTWTYGGNPAESPRDAVRFHAGLTDKNDQLVSDEEIAFTLVEAGADEYEAAARLANHLAAVFARLAESEQLGRRKEEYGDRSAKYASLAGSIRAEAGGTAAAPLVPQIRVADRDAALADTTRTPTQFTVGIHRNSGT